MCHVQLYMAQRLKQNANMLQLYVLVSMTFLNSHQLNFKSDGAVIVLQMLGKLEHWANTTF